MERLNYFNPYESKEPQHEDQLTRAYLVLLKHSSHVFFAFFEYCRDKLTLDNQEQRFSLLEFIENGWIIDTQRSNPEIETDSLLSILITDENIKNDTHVSSSERNARYDGIITFGSKLTIIIENKPASTNVWFDQLNPSRQNLSEDTKIYKTPVILEWKEIIKHLNSLQSISTISGYEKIMIDDFLAFVDEFFPKLNPYDNFSLCKGEEILLNRRIENILKSIVCDSMEVKYYHGGRGYYISTPYDKIKQIGLILCKDDNDWELELSLCFGDSQIPAKNFYKSNPDITKIKKLKDWKLRCNFHVSFKSSNLVWFESTVDIEKYIEYWVTNVDLIYQREKDKVKELIDLLKENNIIIYDINKQKEMENKFFSKKMPTLNICPGFVISFKITSKEAIEKDKTDELKEYISSKIKEGLNIANLDWEVIIK